MISFAWVLAALLLYFTLRGLDWAGFFYNLRQGHYQILLLTVPIAILNYLIRSLRWSVFIGSGRKPSVIEVFWANMFGYMGNLYLPARAGEILRSRFLGQQTGLGTSFVLATAMAERILDALSLVLIGSIALLSQKSIFPVLAGSVRAIAIVTVLGLGFLIIAPFQERHLLTIVRRIPFSQTIGRKISEQLSRFLLGVRSLQSARRLLSFFVLTVIIWLIDALANTIGVGIVDQRLTLPQSLIFLAGLGLSSAIPSTPGYVGVYQFIAVAVLVPFGFSRADALAYILISQISNYLLVTLLGMLALLQLRRLASKPLRNNV
jgi:uncharacterized protein (TIRG00374 family)